MEGEIIEFGVCSGETVAELAGYINEQTMLGYRLHGFVFTSMHEEILFFHQAMILPKPIKRTIKKVNSK